MKLKKQIFSDFDTTFLRKCMFFYTQPARLYKSENVGTPLYLTENGKKGYATNVGGIFADTYNTFRERKIEK